MMAATSTSKDSRGIKSRLQNSHGPTETVHDGSTKVQDQDPIPTAAWTKAKLDARRRQLPQTIAHRGYKAAFPENTLAAFRGAVKAGTDAVETDIHLTRDDVVVLSHDADLKRCFGRPEKIIECDWELLGTVKTNQEPHEPMPRLLDLLEFLALPEQDHIWVLLDIKLDNDPDKVMRLIAETIMSIKPGSKPWHQKVVLGIWAAKFLPLCTQYLPEFPVSNICFSSFYARQFLKVPNVSFNALQKVLVGPIGSRFVRDVKRAGRPLFVWTVDEPNMMKWSIQKAVDGVITDDPKLFKEICDQWDDRQPKARPTFYQFFQILWFYGMILMFSRSFNKKFPETVDSLMSSSGSRLKGKRP